MGVVQQEFRIYSAVAQRKLKCDAAGPWYLRTVGWRTWAWQFHSGASQASEHVTETLTSACPEYSFSGLDMPISVTLQVDPAESSYSHRTHGNTNSKNTA